MSNYACRDDGAKTGAVRMISKILKTTMHLPDRIQAICWVQFWAWIGNLFSIWPFDQQQDLHRQAGFPSSSTLRHGLVKSTSATTLKPTHPPPRTPLATLAVSAPFRLSSFPSSPSSRPSSSLSSSNLQTCPALDLLLRDLRPF